MCLSPRYDFARLRWLLASAAENPPHVIALRFTDRASVLTPPIWAGLRLACMYATTMITK